MRLTARVIGVAGLFALAACGIDVVGGQAPDPASPDAGVAPQHQDGGDAAPGVVTFLDTTTGSSEEATSVTSGDVPAGGDMIVAAVSTKPHEAVTAVTGLGLTWSLVAAQCGGRDTTGVSVWSARGPAAASGTVTAALANAPDNAVIAVSRFSGARTIGPPVSVNSVGAVGACTGGTDGVALTASLAPPAPGAVLFGAVALRGRTLTAGPGCTHRGEVHLGEEGETAGVGVLEAQIPPVSGTLSSDSDWAIVAMQLAP